MSVILITSHDESIYDLKQKPKIVFKKSPRYISKHRGCIKQEATSNLSGKTHATMGVPEEVLPDPLKYLKKKSGRLAYTKINPTAKPAAPMLKKDKVPTLEECLKQYHRPKTSKNFVTKNVKIASNMKTKEPECKIVVEHTGETKALSRGLEPVFIKSAAYGRTPKYLSKVVKDSKKDYQTHKESDRALQPKCRYITRDDREKLLNGLKANWEELQKQYQLLPILTDTIPKVNKKVKLEEELKQLEKDIVLIEKHPYIYVYDDDDLGQT